MDLIEPVRATIRRHDLIRPAHRVLVALSGGPDSVALTHVCRALHDSSELTLVGVAHLNHRLRSEAAADASFCVELARSLQVPIELGDVDVGHLATERRCSIEAAAHDARYTFLRAAAERLAADRIALGHSLDDQAETVLLRLIRGAGARGISGMYPRRGPFVRPLLDVGRDAIRAYLHDRGLTFREDSSNDDLRIPRNRIRAELIPLLARSYNPRIVAILGQHADRTRDEWHWLHAAARELISKAVRGDAPTWTLSVDVLRDAHPAVARAAIRDVLEQASGGRIITSDHVARALACCERDLQGRIDFPGQMWERRGQSAVLTSRPHAHHPAKPAGGTTEGFRHALSIPGEVSVAELGVTLAAKLASQPCGLTPPSDRRESVSIRADRWSGATWSVRTRRPGDRIALSGHGRKKLQDLFVDRKVPRERRDRVPLVVDEHDRVVWVAGHAVSGDFRVTDPAQTVIILTLRLWGGPA
jgi:tRNA(Ile)-lysidine synthase